VDEPAHEAVVREDIVGLSRSARPDPRASFSAIRHRTSTLSGHRRSQGPREPFAFGEWVRIYVITVTQRIEHFVECEVQDTVADARDWGCVTLVAGAGADYDTLAGEFVDGEAGGEFVGWADAFAVGEQVGCCAELEWEQ
jgi:hypothetical protein